MMIVPEGSFWVRRSVEEVLKVCWGWRGRGGGCILALCGTRKRAGDWSRCWRDNRAIVVVVLGYGEVYAGCSCSWLCRCRISACLR